MYYIIAKKVVVGSGDALEVRSDPKLALRMTARGCVILSASFGSRSRFGPRALLPAAWRTAGASPGRIKQEGWPHLLFDPTSTSILILYTCHRVDTGQGVDFHVI